MNRYFVLNARLLLIAAGWAVISPVATGASMLANGGFESQDPKSGWAMPAKCHLEEGAGPDGSRALVWENNDPAYYAFPSYKVTFEPGGVYRFGAKVRKDALETGTAYVSIDWCDRNGKWFASCLAAPVRDNGVSLADGWVHYEGTSAPMPSDVGQGTIHCFLTRGSTGRVRMDDFFLEKKAVEPVELFVSSAYHDTACEGPVRFFASLYINTRQEPLSSYVAEIVYRDANGRTQVRAADAFTANEAHFNLAAEDFAVGTQEVCFRVRNVKTQTTLGSRTRTFTRELTPTPRRVALDTSRRLVVEGKRYFPLGAYVKQMSETNLAKYARGPFNSVVRYGNVSRSEMDGYWRHGLRVSPDIRGFMSVMQADRSEEDLHQKLEAKVKEIGSHPALLTWYVNDEAPLMFAKRLAKVHSWFRQQDPEHPTFAVLDKPQHVRSFMPSYDILAIDSYPIGYFGGKDVGIVSERLWAGDTAMLGYRATWKVPQAFNWAWYRKGEDLKKPNLRMPTREEMANMAWQAIAAGANGLYFYSFDCLLTRLPPDEFEREWAKLCEVGREIKGAEDILLADDDPAGVTGWSRENLAVRVFAKGSRRWLLVANRTMGPVKTTFTLRDAAESLGTGIGKGVTVRERQVEVDMSFCGYALTELRQK